MKWQCLVTNAPKTNLLTTRIHIIYKTKWQSMANECPNEFQKLKVPPKRIYKIGNCPNDLQDLKMSKR